MADMITRCPSCDTSFRITPAQLQTAKGAVRCGACLHIFKALDHLVSDSSKKSTPAKPAPQKAPSAPTVKASAEKKTEEKVHKESPKFEYHKPAVPSPIIALVDDEPKNEPKVSSAKSEAKKAPSPSSVQTDIIDFSVDTHISVDTASKTPANNVTEPKSKTPVKTAAKTPGGTLEFDQAAIDNDNAISGPSASIDDDDILIGDDFPLEDDDDTQQQSGAYGDDLVESFLDLEAWKPKETSLFDREAKPKKSDDDGKSVHDESWALDLLSRDEEEEAAEKESSVHIIKPEERKAPSRQEQEEQRYTEDRSHRKNDFLDDEYSPRSTGSFDALDDDFDGFSTDNLGEPLTDKTQKESHDRKSSFSNDDFDEDYSEDFSESFEPGDNYAGNDYKNDDYNDDDDDDDDDYSDSDYGTGYTGSYSDEPDRHSILSAITPAPVEFHYRGNNSNWLRRSLWALAIFVGIGALIGQIAWIQFDTLSRKQPYRDLYIAACPLLGCDVPNVAVPGMIKITNFLMREHPSVKNSLMVDTILLNTATFEQPFPDLVLTFRNIQEKIVASRRFTPEEYLGGELAGKTNIPSNQPVHLALEIVNPGPQAVGYSAHIPQ